MLIGNYNAQYIGKTMCGFKTGHEYSIDIDKDIYGYTVSGVKDITEDTASDACINYASEKSILRNWTIKEV
jgi:hypothetical protein